MSGKYTDHQKRDKIGWEGFIRLWERIAEVSCQAERESNITFFLRSKRRLVCLLFIFVKRIMPIKLLKTKGFPPRSNEWILGNYVQPQNSKNYIIFDMKTRGNEKKRHVPAWECCQKRLISWPFHKTCWFCFQAVLIWPRENTSIENLKSDFQALG